jgi:hypothetical protein
VKSSRPTYGLLQLLQGCPEIQNKSQFLRVGTPAIQVRSSAGTASIHLDVFPQRREHSWDKYVGYLEVFISFLFTREKPTIPKEKKLTHKKSFFGRNVLHPHVLKNNKSHFQHEGDYTAQKVSYCRFFLLLVNVVKGCIMIMESESRRGLREMPSTWRSRLHSRIANL